MPDREDALEKGMVTRSSFLSRESHGQRSLVGYSPWGCTELDTTKHAHISDSGAYTDSVISGIISSPCLNAGIFSIWGSGDLGCVWLSSNYSKVLGISSWNFCVVLVPAVSGANPIYHQGSRGLRGQLNILLEFQVYQGLTQYITRDFLILY